MNQQSIEAAVSHHQAGCRMEAEAICRQLLSRQPEHAAALHLLGILAAQAGRLDAGVELIRRAIRSTPDFADAWANLGCILVNQGKRDEACAAYRRVIELRPNDAVPHYALGIILRAMGRLDEAIEAFSNATRLKSDFAEAHLKLGMALRSRGRHDDAIAAYIQAIAARPAYAEAHNNLGNALNDMGRVDEAIAAYSRAAQLKPDDVVTCLNLCHALIEKERFDEALEWCRRAVSLAPADARAHEAMGQLLLLKKEMPAAAVSFRAALALSPDIATAWNGLGAAVQALGQVDEAADCFRRAIRISPDEVMFHRNLVGTGCVAADSQSVAGLARLRNRPGASVQDRISAAFALGKLLDDADRFDEAWAHYAEGNALYRGWRASAGERFDAEEMRGIIDRMTRTFTPGFFGEQRQKGGDSELPVFIVGMPRSGTTLVEQIAASHPAVVGAGELPDIPNLAARLSAGGPASLRELNAQSMASVAAAHLHRLRSLGPAELRVIDKLPGNVLHLALIARLFPAARVVFCRRDARDTCLSCYFQWFANKGLLFTYDLADCGWYQREIERLTTHWLKVLPLRMIEVHYEDLVADIEGQSRRLIDFLDLQWDSACLEFHRNRRPVLTASACQVRQPIYTRSVGRWRRYERHLGPLLDVLTTGR